MIVLGSCSTFKNNDVIIFAPVSILKEAHHYRTAVAIGLPIT